jgi:hypothetical protein
VPQGPVNQPPSSALWLLCGVCPRLPHLWRPSYPLVPLACSPPVLEGDICPWLRPLPSPRPHPNRSCVSTLGPITPLPCSAPFSGPSAPHRGRSRESSPPIAGTASNGCVCRMGRGSVSQFVCWRAHTVTVYSATHHKCAPNPCETVPQACQSPQSLKMNRIFILCKPIQ